jgi:hypothetical protein
MNLLVTLGLLASSQLPAHADGARLELVGDVTKNWDLGQHNAFTT